MNDLVKLIFEAAAVKRLKRTGWQILGDNEEDVGGHTFMTSVIAYLLAKQVGANREAVLVMSLFHDFHEARTGEVDKLAKLYVTRDTQKANRDIFGAVDPDLFDNLEVYEQKQTLEAKVVYEANILALGVELKLLMERGNVHAKEWFDANMERLRLPEAQALAKELAQTSSQVWWQKERDTIHSEYKK